MSEQQTPTETQRPSATWLTAVFHWSTPRRLLLLMMGLQLGWLLVIWATGAATAVHKLLPLFLYTLFIGLAAIFLPARLAQQWHKALAFLANHPKTAWLLLAALVLLGGGFYAHQQRLWPFDEEASYEAAVTVARSGISGLMANYQNWGWLATQHPPLAPIIYGQFVRFAGQSLFATRLLSVLCSIGIGWLTYLIGKELYDRRTGLTAAGFIFTFPLFMRLSATAMVEPMLVFLFTLTLYLTLCWTRRQSWPLLLAMGTAAGLGLATKYTMVFVIPIILGFVVLQGSRHQIIQVAGILIVTALVAGAVWGMVASRIHVLQIQLETISHYAGLVLTNNYGRRLLLETITNRLPSAFGVYNIPLLLLGGLLLLGRRSRADWLILLWITAVWLPLFLTLPDHRYFMSSFPAVAILIAVNVQLIAETTERGLLLAILYCLGALYLFVDWARAAQLFVP